MKEKRKGCDLCFARGLLTVCNKQNKNISEFVVPFALLFFLLSEYWYTQQAIFQNNIRVMLLTSSFPTMSVGEQTGGEESRCMA